MYSSMENRAFTEFMSFYSNFTRMINANPDDSSGDLQIIEEVKDCSPLTVTLNVEDDEIVKLLECPTCHEIITPPITVCIGGHCVCNDCRGNLRRCPICRGHFTTVRNILHEQFLDLCLVRCKHWDSGCLVKFPGRELGKHHVFCDFRPIACYSCNMEIQYKQFIEHLQKIENFMPIISSEVTLRFETVDVDFEGECLSCFQPFWIRAHGRDFFCFLDRDEVQFWIWLSVFGPKVECEFNCSIEEKMTQKKYVGEVHCMRKSGLEVLAAAKCLILHENDMQTNAGRIDIMVKINII